MANQFAVLHIQKGGGRAGGLGRHIDRSQVPANADKDKLHLNEILVDHREYGGLKQAIEQRISEGYTKTRALRKDAVKSLNIMLSGSHEQMKKIEEDPEALQAWKQANISFLEKEFGGRDNIVSMALHRDERTPHMHAIIVPITEDGRLSAKDFIGNGKKLARLQDRYAKLMQSHGLERGLKGSRAKHTTVQEYYAKMEAAKEAKIEIPERGFLESNEKYQQRVERALEPLLWQNKGQEEELTRKTRENIALKQQISKQARHIKDIDKLILKVRNGDQATLDKIEALHKKLLKKAERRREYFRQHPNATEEDFQRSEIKIEYQEAQREKVANMLRKKNDNDQEQRHNRGLKL